MTPKRSPRFASILMLSLALHAALWPAGAVADSDPLAGINPLEQRDENASACESTCQEFETTDPGIRTRNHCGEKPPEADHDRSDRYDACAKAWADAESGGQLGPQCRAYGDFKEAKSADFMTLVTAGLAAGACGAACVALNTGGAMGGYAEYLVTACEFAGGAHGVMEFAQRARLTIRKRALKEFFSIAREHASMEWWGLLEADAEAAGATVDPGSTSPDQGGSTKGQVAKKVMVCGTALMFGAMAALKYYNYQTSQDNAKKTCGTIKRLSTDALGVVPGGGGGPGQKLAQAAGGAAQDGVVAAGASIGDPVATAARMAVDAWNGKQQSAASAVKDAMEQMPNRDRIPKGFQDATGLTPQRFAEKLASGTGPGALIGGMAGLPSDLAATMKGLDRDAASGNISMLGLGGGTAYASGGGGGARSQAGGDAGFGGLLGGGDSAGPKTQRTMSFAEASPDNDIWHSRFAGSIFEIISRKLDQDRGKVEQLEWSVPINRAAAGLPPEPERK